jgi:hypothetical protein
MKIALAVILFVFAPRDEWPNVKGPLIIERPFMGVGWIAPTPDPQRTPIRGRICESPRIPDFEDCWLWPREHTAKKCFKV